MRDAYVARAAEGREARQTLKVAWDTGNGAVGESIRAVVDKLPGEHFLLIEKIDGTFPAHHPDPTVPKNLEQLQAEVKKQGCDLGIAFDGDGDRIGAIDGKGRILWGDQLLVPVVARRAAEPSRRHHHRRRQGEPGPVRRDRGARRQAADVEDRPFADQERRWPRSKCAAGRRDVRAHLLRRHLLRLRRRALLRRAAAQHRRRSGEQSLADYARRLPQPVNTPELRFHCAEERKFAVVDEVKARLQKAGANVNDIDGVRVSTPDGWWLLRASNTQDVLVARCEAPTRRGSSGSWPTSRRPWRQAASACPTRLRPVIDCACIFFLKDPLCGLPLPNPPPYDGGGDDG